LPSGCAQGAPMPRDVGLPLPGRCLPSRYRELTPSSSWCSAVGVVSLFVSGLSLDSPTEVSIRILARPPWLAFALVVALEPSSLSGTVTLTRGAAALAKATHTLVVGVVTSPGWLVLEAATLALTSATVTLTRGAVAGERRIRLDGDRAISFCWRHHHHTALSLFIVRSLPARRAHPRWSGTLSTFCGGRTGATCGCCTSGWSGRRRGGLRLHSRRKLTLALLQPPIIARLRSGSCQSDGIIVRTSHQLALATKSANSGHPGLPTYLRSGRGTFQIVGNLTC